VSEPATDVDQPAAHGSDESLPAHERRPADPVSGEHDTAAPRSVETDGTVRDRPRGWRRLRSVDRSVVVVCGIIAIGFALAVHGLLTGVTGDDRANLPPLIESVDPVPEAVQVLSQSNVFVDLAAEYTGVLVVDGVEIQTVNVDEVGTLGVEPGQQVELPPVTIYEPGNATLTFTPGENAPIQEFTEGEHRVQVVYWRIDEGRRRARSYTWTFTVV
jgi:hypothetical protein